MHSIIKNIVVVTEMSFIKENDYLRKNYAKYFIIL